MVDTTSAIRFLAGPALATASLIEPAEGTFDPSELGGLPEPVQRLFRHAIAPGTPLARSAHVQMRGHVKVGRWLPFRATEVLTPRRGFVWRAHVVGALITGSDHYVAGHGAMAWKLLGLVPVMTADGPDTARSAAARGVGEAMWLPTALLPRFGVEWTAEADDLVCSRLEIDGVPVTTRHRLAADGAIASATFDRWGDPDQTGAWAWHPFGCVATAHHTFGGLTIPSEGRVGWHPERWPDGEFFRYRITALDPVDEAG